MEFVVSPYEDKDENEWDNYANNCPYSTIFHTIGWKKVMESTFGYLPEYYTIKSPNQKIVGICPAFKTKTLFGKAIISQPFFEYGGPIIDDGYGEAFGALLERYKTRADNKEVKYIEFKAVNGIHDNVYENSGFVKAAKAVSYSIDIKDKDFEKDIWNKLYTRKSRARNSVRAAIKCGLKVAENYDMDAYYSLYIKTISRLGSMPYPRSFFDNIMKYTRSQVRFVFAYLDDKPVAALMSFPKNERHLLVGLVSDPEYLDCHANDLLYNEQIEYATKNHFSIIDFGRTRPNSPYEQFKSKWGATRMDMYSYIYPDSKKEDINPYKYYTLFSSITKKIPWIFAKTKLGPYLVNKFP